MKVKNLRNALIAVAAAFTFAGCDKLYQEEVVDGDGDDSDRESLFGEGDELHIYTWSDYIDPEIIEAFEDDCGCRVIVDTFDSNESMYAQLKSGGVAYDIVTPTSYMIGRMAKEGLIRELDQTKIPNVLANFDRSFTNQLLDSSFKYGVPYAVTYGGFCYLKKKIPTGVDINTWTVLSNSVFKEKVTLLDDIRETIGAALMSLGYSINSTNPAEIEAAVVVLKQWKANIRKFDAESYKTEVASGTTWIGHGYSTDSMQIILGDKDEEMPERQDIGFALPKEGFSIAFDELVLCTASTHPDLAYAFMNYMYKGEVARKNMEYILGPMPVKPGIDALERNFRAKIILPPEIVRYGQVLDAIDSVPGAMELYDNAWERVKSTR